MAGDGEIKVRVTPVFDEDLVDMIERTGEALSSLARTLRRLNDGGPDTMRSAPVPTPECPFSTSRTVHDRHTMSAVTLKPGTVDTDTITLECPGWPA